MTGYGHATAELGEARISIELRSLNHRYADLRLRLPQELSSSERDIRRRVLKKIKRGRVELNVNVEPLDGRSNRPQLNHALVREVLAATKKLSDEYKIDGAAGLDTLLQVPGMFRTGPIELEWDDEQREILTSTLGTALDALDDERRREGKHLQEEMSTRLAGMSAITAEIRERAAVLPSNVRDRLVERLESLSKSVELDPARVAQEAAMLADRCDVTEELVRLEGHLEQARSLIDKPDGEALGKRLDFLLQEINRETNTVNSKSADLDMSRKALALKAEVEKVREQVQNVE